MDVPTTLCRSIAIGASCLIHVGVAAGLVVVGIGTATSRTPSVLMAELVASEPPKPEPPKPIEPPTRAHPVPARPPTKLTLPKPIRTPEVEPSQPVPPVEPTPPAPAAVEAPKPVETPKPPDPVAPPAPPARVDTRTAMPSLPSPALAASAGAGPASPATSSTQPDGVTMIDAREVTAGSARDSAPSAASTPASTALAIPNGITQTAIPRGGYQVRPSYPGTARRLGIQGTTTLRIFVSADGRVTDVVVEQSAGHPDLDHAASDAVRRWRFEPARRGTEAVGMWVLLPVEFRLR
jgi:protein TonB